MRRTAGRYFTLVLIATALLLVATNKSYAVKPLTLFVPDDHASIQDAIDRADDGMTILIRSGVYTERITFRGKAVTLRSLNGPETTVIDGTGGGSVVSFVSGEGRSSRLVGFTVTGGNAEDGGGILITSSSPEIADCIVTGNSANHGGGLYIAWDAIPLITGTVITGNTALSKGGGLQVAKAFPDIYRTVISGNTAPMAGGICAHSTSVVYLTECTVSGNTAAFNGGGIHSCWYSWIYLFASTVADNTAGSYGGGVHIDQHGSLRAWNSLFHNNDAYLGGGISVQNYEAHAYIHSSTVTANTGFNAGIYANDVSTALLYSTIVHGNSSAPYLGSGASVDHSDIEGGHPGTGNIDADPLFINAPAMDYRLSNLSPCRDSGSSFFPPDTDFDGIPRPLGAGYDMGAYEYIPPEAMVDTDRDGYYVFYECDDTDPASYPGAPEIKRDGIDQDCNGRDMTIEITRAVYNAREDSIRVDATSLFDAEADLEVLLLGPMTWTGKRHLWSLSSQHAGGNPGTVTVCGPEGCETATVVDE